MSSKSVIEVPEDLQDIFPEFLENRRKEAAALPGTIERCDFKQIRTWGHNMAGVGEGYGFPALTVIGRELEAAALSENVVEIQKCAAKFSDAVNNVEVHYVP